MPREWVTDTGVEQGRASRPWCISWLHNLWVSPGEMRSRESHAECSARQSDHRQAVLVSLLKNFPAGLLKHHRLVFKLESCRPQLCLEWISALMWVRVADSDMKGAFSPPTLATLLFPQWLERTNWVANKKASDPGFLNSEFLTNMCVLVTQLWWTLCDPVGYSPPGSSVHGIL